MQICTSTPKKSNYENLNVKQNKENLHYGQYGRTKIINTIYSKGNRAFIGFQTEKRSVIWKKKNFKTKRMNCCFQGFFKNLLKEWFMINKIS